MDHVLDIAAGAFLVFGGWFIFLWAKKGWTWGVAKLKAWWSAGSADITKLKSDFAALVSRVTALESKPAAIAPAPVPPNAAAALGSANTVNGVQQSPSA